MTTPKSTTLGKAWKTAETGSRDADAAMVSVAMDWAAAIDDRTASLAALAKAAGLSGGANAAQPVRHLGIVFARQVAVTGSVTIPESGVRAILAAIGTALTGSSRIGVEGVAKVITSWDGKDAGEVPALLADARKAAAPKAPSKGAAKGKGSTGKGKGTTGKGSGSTPAPKAVTWETVRAWITSAPITPGDVEHVEAIGDYLADRLAEYAADAARVA